MSDWDQSQQAYDDSSTYGEPAVGGWGDSYGDAPTQEQEEGQGFWDDLTDWVDDLVHDDSSQQESSDSGGGIVDVIEQVWRPAQEHIDQRNRLMADHLAAFRGSLNSAIQATEPLGAESSSDQVQHASGLITSAANAAYFAADDIGRETQTGGKYAYYHGALAEAASELEAIAWSNSEAVRRTDIPNVLAKLYIVGRDSESLC